MKEWGKVQPRSQDGWREEGDAKDVKILIEWEMLLVSEQWVFECSSLDEISVTKCEGF